MAKFSLLMFIYSVCMPRSIVLKTADTLGLLQNDLRDQGLNPYVENLRSIKASTKVTGRLSLRSKKVTR